jgi:hypothetical protein
MSSRTFVLAALVALVSVAGSACGKKGDPLPPLRAIPAAAQDLSVRQQGTDLFLEMAYPNVTMAGDALPGIESLEVLQLLRPAPAAGFEVEVQPREFAGAAEPFLELRGDRLAASTAGNRLALRLALEGLPEEPDEARIFGVRATATNGETSGISNLVAIVPRQPPAAPGELKLLPGEAGIEVQWQIPEGVSEDEGALEGFHVYRRDARSRNYGAPLHTAAQEQDRYLDRSARFGQRYIYTVTAVAATEPLIESGLGGEAEVFYQDRFPPSAPSGVVALTEAERVRLRWDAGSDADIVGYYVYRKGQNDFVRLIRAPLREREYVDERVRTGRTYVYRVTAVDAQGNESEASPEVTTTIR